jgi:voltage-gated potassium channel
MSAAGRGGTLKERILKFLNLLRTDWTLRFYLVLLFGQIALYTIVVHSALPVLEGRVVSWTEAILFVVETMTTVGYGDQLPFTNELTNMIVIVIMSIGVFTVLMVIPVLLTPYLSSTLRATPPQKLTRDLNGHVVIAGYDELTRELVQSLMISDLSIVIVHPDEETCRTISRSYRNGVSVIWGEYTDPATWNHAQVRTASNIIINEDERITATIILGIREKTGGRIIAVVDDLAFDRYLRYAGAEYVLSPKNTTGKILARHAVLRPEVDTVYEEVFGERKIRGYGRAENALKLIKAPIMEGCRCSGKSLKDLDLLNTYGVDVLFFWKAGEFVQKPGDDDIVDTTTMLFLLGKEDALVRALEKELQSTVGGEDLAVIAGYGDVGKAADGEFSEAAITSIIVDPRAKDVNVVSGNAEYESVLKDAHIEDARFLVVAVNDDNVNIFTTLMARNLNSGLRILARANESASVDKLYLAGADFVALLPTIGGQVIAGIVLADIVQVLLDLPNGQKVVMKHRMKTKTITAGDLERDSGVRVLGIEGPHAHSVIHPGAREPIREGDGVIAVGGIDEVKRFIRMQ